MEEVKKNVVSVTLTREDFQNLFNPLLDSIMSKEELSETTKFTVVLTSVLIYKELEDLIFGN